MCAWHMAYMHAHTTRPDWLIPTWSPGRRRRNGPLQCVLVVCVCVCVLLPLVPGLDGSGGGDGGGDGGGGRRVDIEADVQIHFGRVCIIIEYAFDALALGWWDSGDVSSSSVV